MSPSRRSEQGHPEQANDEDNRAHGPMEFRFEQSKTATEAKDAEKPKGECAPVDRLVSRTSCGFHQVEADVVRV